MNPSTEFQVVAKTGNTITLKKGYCNINGAIAYTDEDIDIVLENAGTQSRIDRIILRLDDNTNFRNIREIVLKGVESTDPTAPALTRSTSVYDLCVASILRTANSTQILQSNITDTRADTNLCGIVHGTVKEADSDTLYMQIQSDLKEFKDNEQAEFIAWLDTIKGKLSEDIAGSLQLQIDNLEDNKSPVNHIHDERYYTESEINTKIDDLEPKFNKNAAFNKNFGTSAGTVCQGNDSRLSNARPPTSHTHDDRYYTESESNALYKLKGDFAIVTGNITLTSGSGSVSLNLPSDFTVTNCVPISMGVAHISTAPNAFSFNNISGSSYITATFTNSGTAFSLVVNSFTSGGTTGSKPFKIVLMKI